MRRQLWLLAGLLPIACTAPAGPPPNLTGTYGYNAFDLTGPGRICTVEGVTLRLSEAINASGVRKFSGTLGAGTIVCNRGPTWDTTAFAGSSLANGVFDGTAISFDFVTPEMHHTGKWSEGSSLFPWDILHGDVTMQHADGGTVTVLTGKFAATKSP